MDDLISREAVYMANEHLKPCSPKDVEYMISCIPSAQPQWIPCSERYPEENQICIVTDETMRNTYEYRFCKETYDENQGWTYLKHRIIAWMPLPKPYKGGKDD